MKMFLISDNIDTYTGMRLVGVDGVVVHQKKELENAFKAVFQDPQIGIVLLTEKFSRDFPEYVTQIKMESHYLIGIYQKTHLYMLIGLRFDNHNFLESINYLKF